MNPDSISTFGDVANPADWQRCLEAYDISSKEANDFKGNPIDGLEPLAKAKVPIFLVLGAKDDVVPLSENADILEERYKVLGGSVTRWVKPDANHHPHGLHPVQPVVDAILKAAGEVVFRGWDTLPFVSECQNSALSWRSLRFDF